METELDKFAQEYANMLDSNSAHLVEFTREIDSKFDNIISYYKNLYNHEIENFTSEKFITNILLPDLTYHMKEKKFKEGNKIRLRYPIINSCRTIIGDICDILLNLTSNDIEIDIVIKLINKKFAHRRREIEIYRPLNSREIYLVNSMTESEKQQRLKDENHDIEYIDKYMKRDGEYVWVVNNFNILESLGLFKRDEIHSLYYKYPKLADVKTFIEHFENNIYLSVVVWLKK